MNPVYDMFNDLAENMIKTEGGEEFLANTVTLVGASKEQHTLSLAQAKQFIGIIEGNHPYLTDYNPLEFLVFSYQFQDKIKAGYLAIQFQIIYDHESKEIYVSGMLKHPMTVEGHADYNPEALIPPIPFQTTIDNVGLYGNLALVNSIAAQSEQLSVIRGSYGGSFIYEFGGGKQSIRKYEPQEVEELDLDQDELQKAIGIAKERVLAGIPVDDVTIPGKAQ